MKRTWLVVVALSVNTPAGARADEVERAATELAKLGAKIRRDETVADRPVIRIFWESDRAANKDLAHLKALPRLQLLALECSRVSDAGLAHLKNLKALRELRISGDHFTDRGAVHLGALKQLTTLHFYSDELTDAGLAEWKNLASLEELVISSPKVTDDGLVHLKGLKKLRSLRLGLRSKVTPKGAAALRKVLPGIIIKY